MKIKIILLICLLSCGAIQESEVEKINGLCLVAPPYEVLLEHHTPILDVGANWVAIIPYAFCSPSQPKVSFDHPRQWQGETTKGITKAIQLAHQSNLKVMIKPHLWVSGQGWAGDLNYDNSNDIKLWKSSYTEYILHFAKVAQEHKVEMMSIGTEVRHITTNHPYYWMDLINQIRAVYKGSLTYSANWDNYENISFWDKLDYIGIDAYFPISESMTPTVEELLQKAQKTKLNIGNFSNTHLKKVLFTEFGFKSTNYCTAGHWKSALGNQKPDFEGQANAYEAFFGTYWNEDWFAGGFAWKWHYKHEEAGGITNYEFTPQNKLAEKILKKQYAKF
ncbi:glycoside hydrolase family 113 [Reichenbachiella faecimaris]|uniref:glycoside hydrolase family 113 n=1 Tax=Reichenbachiella faecimaris TaxID=692418 RepID=UPI00111C28B3|nr:hypothetical protein [Reichenbachiella faecimaris]